MLVTILCPQIHSALNSFPRTVTLTRDDLNQMIEMWLSEMTNTHTCVDAREYTEAYIDDDSEKDTHLPNH